MFLPLPNTRKLSTLLDISHYFTGKPCKHGHISRRRVLGCACLQCDIIHNSIHTKANPKQKARRNRRYRETHIEEKAAYSTQWCRANPDKVNAQGALKRARKLHATPSWLTSVDKDLMRATYSLSQELSASTGILHHVDHIVPLQGKTVCGLHVPSNLRVIPATENLKKSNSYLQV